LSADSRLHRFALPGNDAAMRFELVGESMNIETIATGRGIRSLRQLSKRYGRGRWRKLKGFGEVLLDSGEIVRAELHWYEAAGIGRRGMKIKRFV
jgi:hypothetical protein